MRQEFIAQFEILDSARYSIAANLINWRARRDSNPRPPGSKYGFLSSELLNKIRILRTSNCATISRDMGT